MGALDGVRVIDFGQWVAGPLAAQLLADQGAEVIHVDPPGGPRWRSPANATLNRGKQRLTLDLKQAGDLAYARELITTADVVIENFRPGVMRRLGLGPEAFASTNPRLVYCSLPGFASDDPRAGVQAWEGLISAATGVYWNGSAEASPRFTALPLCSSFGALAGAIAIVMALIARERDGLGQTIEVPLFDATFLLIGAGGLLVNGKPEGQRPDDPWTGVFECADGGKVRLNFATYRFLTRFVDAAAPEWYERGFIEKERPGSLRRGTPQREALDQAIRDLFKTRSAGEWEAFGREVDVPLTRVRTAAEWLASPHGRHAGHFVEVDDPELGRMVQPGPAVRLRATPGAVLPRPASEADRASLRRPAPEAVPPAANRLAAALEGVRVLDLTQVLAGPTATRTLAEFGADVIKINNPWEEGAGYRWNPHRYHTDVNRGKATILLDLKTPEGLDVFWRLFEDADVVMQNFRRGVAERLGVGYEQLRRRKPQVIYGSVSLMGYDGEWEMMPGYEPNAQAVTGMTARMGGPMPFAPNDYATGLLGAFGLALALFHRFRSGEGQELSTSLVAAGTFLQTVYMQDYEGKRWDEPAGPEARGWSPLQRLYRAQDGWLFLAAADEQRAALASVPGLEAVAGLEGDALAAALEQAIAAEPSAVWQERLSAAGIGVQAVVSATALMNDPWVVEHGLSVTRTHAGGDQITTIGPPQRLSRTPVVPGRPVSPPGGDAAEVLQRAGLADRLDELVERQVILLD